MSNNFLLLLLCLLLAMTQGQQMRFRLPPGYNMRLGAMPSRFVGTGAYTLSGKRTTANNNWQQQLQLKQQQLQQPKQAKPQYQRMEFLQWATRAGK